MNCLTELSELVELDRHLITHKTDDKVDWDKSACDIVKEMRARENDNDSGESDDEDDLEITCDNQISKSDAIDMMAKLKLYSKQVGSAVMLDYISKAKEELNTQLVKQCKQTNIRDFLILQTGSQE